MDKGRHLDSWKEIAEYLNRNVRTCQVWERELGLPVHRLDGSPKARVSAYTGEIDRWREDQYALYENSAAITEPHVGSRRARARRLRTGLIVGSAAILILAGLFLSPLRSVLTGRQADKVPIVSVIKLEPGRSLGGMRRPDQFDWPTRTSMAISSDAAFVVICAADDGSPGAVTNLFLRRLDEPEARKIPGTEGGLAPFLSPDQRWVGFWADGRLRRVPIEGGVAQEICPVATFMGACWLDGGAIVFAGPEDSGLFRVEASGGIPEVLTRPDPGRAEYSHRLPSVLPDGRSILFTVTRSVHDPAPGTAILDLVSRTWRDILPDSADTRYIPTGHVIFARRGTLMAAPFDEDRKEVLGRPVPVVADVMQAMNFPSSAYDSAAAQYAVSRTGTLVYARGGILPDRRNALVWIDRAGNEIPVGAARAAYFAPRLSPDGRTVAYYTLGMEKQIWLYDLDRDVSTPFMTEGLCAWPLWMPDGKGLAVSWADSAAHTNLYRRMISGSGELEKLTDDATGKFGSSVSPDGRSIAYVGGRGGKDTDIGICDTVTRTVRAFAASDFDESYPEFSPNGLWIAYCANPEGHLEVYVRSAAGAGDVVKISAEGGREPAWARDGQTLFFRSLDYSQMMAVDIRARDRLAAGKPRRLFERKGLGGGHPVRGYDVSADGRRFLMVRNEERRPRPATELTLVQNWFRDIRRLTPPK